MKIKMILKKANSTTRTTSEISKCYKDSTLSDAQNAGNRISELLDFNFFWGRACPQTPWRKGALWPILHLQWPLTTLHLQWPLTTKVIETPALWVYQTATEVYNVYNIHVKWGCKRVYENAMKPLTAAGTVKTDTCT